MLFYGETGIFSSINIIAAFIFAIPIVIVKYLDYSRLREVEDMFPVFLRDFVESIRGGMTMPAALKAVSANDYKALTPYVCKMSAQLDWGIPVERVLLNFADRSKSKLIKRIISSVRESHRFGGNLADTFEALSNTAVEVDRLRAERRLYLNSQMITGYVVFFVFLAVIIGLEKFLVPSLTTVSPIELSGGATTVANQQNIAEAYKELFRNLILIQGLFAGLAVGKMAEGAIIAGLKHSLFMMLTGVLVFIVAG
jgi:flagellar protein FlaJ